MSHSSVERPTQAVILAGGRGTRLAPITNDLPKPMVRFHGKPFLEYLVEMLREGGFDRILLLLGYLPEVVQDYFGDGHRWNVDISYSVSPVEDETGMRLKRAAPMLDSCFLLTYCDNYWPMQFNRMWESFSRGNPLAQVTIYDNSDDYTRDNLLVGADGLVTVYDKSRTQPNLRGVDIGFLILRKSALDQLPGGNVSLEASLYPRLIEKRQLAAYVTGHRYYSVSTVERLSVTEEFLARRPAVLVDRDGVLNQKMRKAEYVCSWSDWRWLPGAKEALRTLTDANFRVIVITNQAGIARNALTEAGLAEIHSRMCREVEDSGGRIDAIYCCPHGWDDDCACRKPKPGLLFQAQRDFGLDLSLTTFIGDDERDAEAAYRAGSRFKLVDKDNSLRTIARELVAGMTMAA